MSSDFPGLPIFLLVHSSPKAEPCGMRSQAGAWERGKGTYEFFDRFQEDIGGIGFDRDELHER